MNKENQSHVPHRYDFLDSLRGIALISMIVYHTVWDVVYIGDWDWSWFRTDTAYVWQQSICWTFILLSGFCWALGRRRVKRGLTVLGAGILTSLVTWNLPYEQRVTFGILTFLGAVMLLMIPLDKIFKKLPAVPGFVLSMLLFLLTKEINHEYLGIGMLRMVELPHAWNQKGPLLTFLGFTNESFYSADYFSILPWIFLFLAGHFLQKIACEKDLLDKIARRVPKLPLAVLGRHSLLIYLLHQPLIYFVLMLLGVIPNLLV